MWPTYLKSTAVPVDKIFQTEILKCDSRFVMWHVLRDLLLTETLSASWVFSMIDTWHHKHSSVMKQQSNKVTEPSQGSVMTVIDYLALAVFKASEVPCSTDKNCSKWQLLAGRKVHSVYLRGSGPNTNWTVCIHHQAFICSPPSATRLNTNI